jgi:hypothetical protein
MPADWAIEAFGAAVRAIAARYAALNKDFIFASLLSEGDPALNNLSKIVGFCTPMLIIG